MYSGMYLTFADQVAALVQPSEASAQLLGSPPSAPHVACLFSPRVLLLARALKEVGVRERARGRVLVRCGGKCGAACAAAGASTDVGGWAGEGAGTRPDAVWGEVWRCMRCSAGAGVATLDARRAPQGWATTLRAT
eukprot:86369-Chlamydomonas_euryale.AAC.1